MKLHQSVTLSCEHKCFPRLAKWTLLTNRDVVFAHCDETSCSSMEGFNMSYDQYLKGDLSLTISKADYRMRNTFVCECSIAEISKLHLSIESKWEYSIKSLLLLIKHLLTFRVKDTVRILSWNYTHQYSGLTHNYTLTHCSKVRWEWHTGPNIGPNATVRILFYLWFYQYYWNMS